MLVEKRFNSLKGTLILCLSFDGEEDTFEDVEFNNLNDLIGKIKDKDGKFTEWVKDIYYPTTGYEIFAISFYDEKDKEQFFFRITNNDTVSVINTEVSNNNFKDQSSKNLDTLKNRIIDLNKFIEQNNI